MHPNPRKIVLIIIVIVLASLALWYFGSERASADPGKISASGTIEAVEITISSEFSGRVLQVNFTEGRRVEAGDILIELDTSMLIAQRDQAIAALAVAQGGESAALAALAAAQANAVATEANLKLIEAGPSDEQVAVARTVVEKSQIAADAAQEAYDDLSEAARETTQGKNLKQQLDLALASLDNAKAQLELVRAGARRDQIEASKAQVTGAQAQVEAARAQTDIAGAQVKAAEAAISILNVQIAKMTLAAPLSGVILSQAVHPGELALPGSPLMTIGQLDELTLTVYLPEDRYGLINLGQTARVVVDSFPGSEFSATVVHIADKAEFTPRNVQTAEGRRTTVFAVRLSLESSGGKLKPGMPADVSFND